MCHRIRKRNRLARVRHLRRVANVRCRGTAAAAAQQRSSAVRALLPQLAAPLLQQGYVRPGAPLLGVPPQQTLLASASLRRQRVLRTARGSPAAAQR